MSDFNTQPPASEPADENTPAVAVTETELSPAEAFTTTFREERNASLQRIFAILLLLGALTGLLLLLSPDMRVATHLSAIPTQGNQPDKPLQTSQFPSVTLEAKSAYVYDIANARALYGKNPTAQLPLASITKLMTVLVGSEIFHNEGLLAFGSDDTEGTHPNSPFPSTRWVPNDVFTYTLIQSSNLGATIIASAVGAIAAESEVHDQARDIFIERMNTKAKALGLTQTYFINETGLDTTQAVGGGYGSARDSALLITALLESNMEVLEQTRLSAVEFEATDQSTMVAINTNTEIGSIPGLLGSKTGYTRLAGGNLAIVFDAGLGRPIAVVVLGSTEAGRFSDVKALVDATLVYLSETSNAPRP